jgi:hypothetical protein
MKTKTAKETKTISERVWEIIRENTDERSFGCTECDKDESHLVIEDMSLLRIGIENLIEKEMISPYNLAHLELGGDCCGIFNILDGNGIIRCNECNATIHDAVHAFTAQEVEAAIAERMPTKGDLYDAAYRYSKKKLIDKSIMDVFADGAEWFRSRMEKKK